ncbi:hypothetical protein [Paenibacillus nuruki]|uniref:hypothetical protein n=1 Tax=Paenibacillus nuruki TaxID=1886670 RepID=UPI00280447FE|nr:hypothetical protein [Paenibacillus nuruki]CAJ1313825.1 DUF2313 domain-containing protein [Paenibacillus nuruki]
MEPLLKSKAMQILDPYIIQVKEAINKGVKDYYIGEDYAAIRHKHSSRTAASICHDNIIEEIKQRFENQPNVLIKKSKGLYMLIIEGIIVIRFKKFDEKLNSSGISTKQAIAYDYQDPLQLDLDDMPPDGLLFAGYTLNDLQSNVDRIFITYKYGSVNIWDWNITDEGIATDLQPALFPLPAASETSTRKKRVRAKDKSINAGDENAINK